MVGFGQCPLDQPGERGAAWGAGTGLRKLGGCLVQLALGFQDETEGVAGLGEVWIESDRLTGFGDRLLQLF
jgi:hypothetical protein